LEEIKVILEDAPRLIWVLVSYAYSKLWTGNVKLHDLGELMNSIETYGWQELPKYDATLGAIKAGNGRIEALYMMEREKMNCPRGVAVVETGEWAMAIICGVDAESEEMAISYAIDSNNITMLGGDFTAVDQSRMWGKEYVDVLEYLKEKDAVPVSVGDDNIDELIKALGKSKSEPIDKDDGLFHCNVTISKNRESELIEVIEDLGCEWSRTYA